MLGCVQNSWPCPPKPTPATFLKIAILDNIGAHGLVTSETQWHLKHCLGTTVQASLRAEAPVIGTQSKENGKSGQRDGVGIAAGYTPPQKMRRKSLFEGAQARRRGGASRSREHGAWHTPSWHTPSSTTDGMRNEGAEGVAYLGRRAACEYALRLTGHAVETFGWIHRRLPRSFTGSFAIVPPPVRERCHATHQRIFDISSRATGLVDESRSKLL